MIPCRDISSTGAHCSSQMRCRKQCWKHSVMRCQGKRSSRERVERAPLGGVSENEVYTYIYILYYYVWYLLRIVISWCYFSNFKRESADLPVDLGLIFRQTQLVRHVFSQNVLRLQFVHYYGSFWTMGETINSAEECRLCWVLLLLRAFLFHE